MMIMKTIAGYAADLPAETGNSTKRLQHYPSPLDQSS
jgi:hypothetical protein